MLTTLPTIVLLIFANLIPLYLVAIGQWTVGQLVLLFWLENVVIGVVNVTKMLMCQPQKRPRRRGDRDLITFFCIHFGGFALFHGAFVMVFFFAIEFEFGTLAGPETIPSTFASANFWWALAALALSHAFSFGWHFLKGGERLSDTTESLFLGPYARVVILQVTTNVGAWLAAWLRQPLWALVLLVALKIGVDLVAHLRSHRKSVSKG